MAQLTAQEKEKARATGQYLKEVCDNPACRKFLTYLTYVGKVGGKELHFCSDACRSVVTGDAPVRHKERKASPEAAPGVPAARTGGGGGRTSRVSGADIQAARTAVVELMASKPKQRFTNHVLHEMLPCLELKVIGAATKEMVERGQMKRKNGALLLLDTVATAARNSKVPVVAQVAKHLTKASAKATKAISRVFSEDAE